MEKVDLVIMTPFKDGTSYRIYARGTFEKQPYDFNADNFSTFVVGDCEYRYSKYEYASRISAVKAHLEQISDRD